MVPTVSLDTDILSLLLRQQPVVVARVRAYKLVHSRIALSIITRYEILRGLKAKGATGQQKIFERLCAKNQVLPLTDDIVVRAADIYAYLRRRGILIEDADILIAATALDQNLVLVTNNEAHFRRVPGLQIENWLKP